MRIVSLKDSTQKIKGVAVEIFLDGTLKFTRYGVNENGKYMSDIILEGIQFDDPSDDFSNMNKPSKKIESLKRKALREVAEKLFPSLKVLYLEA